MDAVINLRTVMSNCVCVSAHPTTDENSSCSKQSLPIFTDNAQPGSQPCMRIKGAIFESLQEFGNSSIVLAKRTSPGAF